MNKPSLIAGKGWHFVRPILWFGLKQHGFQSFEKNYEDDSLNITQM